LEGSVGAGGRGDGGVDLAEVRVRQIAGRGLEVRVVEDVEEVGAHAQLETLGDFFIALKSLLKYPGARKELRDRLPKLVSVRAGANWLAETHWLGDRAGLAAVTHRAAEEGAQAIELQTVILRGEQTLSVQ
jgi:hypothetical protein